MAEVDIAGAVEAAVALVTSQGLVSFYDGEVPGKVPMNGAYIAPYVVLWWGTPNNPLEVSSCGEQDTGTEVHDFQVSVVAASTQACRAVTRELLKVLINSRVGTGLIRRNPEGFDTSIPLEDTQESPTRYLLPVQLRLITN